MPDSRLGYGWHLTFHRDRVTLERFAARPVRLTLGSLTVKAVVHRRVVQVDLFRCRRGRQMLFGKN